MRRVSTELDSAQTRLAIQQFSKTPGNAHGDGASLLSLPSPFAGMVKAGGPAANPVTGDSYATGKLDPAGLLPTPQFRMTSQSLELRVIQSKYPVLWTEKLRPGSKIKTLPQESSAQTLLSILVPRPCTQRTLHEPKVLFPI